ncbi:MAG: hypothetical protein HYS12_26320 [Planctomycetes bacterium]|nr:hypothetical protein [Planctomycetota bacterium]
MTLPSRSESPRQRPAGTAGERHSKSPAPGDFYRFRLDTGTEPEWLIVRAHPDDPQLLLVVPVDDFPLAGPPDEVLPPGPGDRPRVARCGQALWLPAGHLLPPLQAGTVPEEVVRLVRRKIAELARGQVVATAKQQLADHDPSYERWLAGVEQARRRLQARVDEGRPLLRLAELAPEPPPGLAALAGGEERYLALPVGGGKLVLLADAQGVRAVWTGPVGEAPALTGEVGAGQLRAVTWQAGPEGALARAEPVFRWLDGRVVLTVCSDPPQSLTLQR